MTAPIYNFKERQKIYNDLKNPESGEADLSLLKKKSPFHDLIKKVSGRDLKRYANEILFILLDFCTREEIRQNRREYEQSKTKEDVSEHNTGGSDAEPKQTGRIGEDKQPTGGSEQKDDQSGESGSKSGEQIDKPSGLNSFEIDANIYNVLAEEPPKEEKKTPEEQPPVKPKNSRKKTNTQTSAGADSKTETSK